MKTKTHNWKENNWKISMKNVYIKLDIFNKRFANSSNIIWVEMCALDATTEVSSISVKRQWATTTVPVNFII